ncbi:MAG: hypothetical protein Q8O09_01140 [Bacillota bacterium]|nr:hypothetical protein [Bacillota bacterium]
MIELAIAMTLLLTGLAGYVCSTLRDESAKKQNKKRTCPARIAPTKEMKKPEGPLLLLLDGSFMRRTEPAAGGPEILNQKAFQKAAANRTA